MTICGSIEELFVLLSYAMNIFVGMAKLFEVITSVFNLTVSLRIFHLFMGREGDEEGEGR